MYFKVNKKEFSDAINVVSKAVSQNSPMPILHNIKISVKEDYLKLTASDADISIETIIKKNEDNLETISVGDILIDGKYLGDMIRKTDSDKIEFEVLDGNLCGIRGNAVNFEVNGINAEEYPLIRFDEPEEKITLDVETFKDIIFQTCFAASDKETKPILTGVNFNCEGTKLTCIATDSYRLAKKEVILDSEHNFNITIPAKNLSDISKILSTEGSIDIAIDDKKALFILNNILIQTRLIDGLYPEVARLIPVNFDYELIIESKDILNALDRASFIKNEGIFLVRMQINEEKIMITSKSNDIISQETIVPISFYGEPLDISFKGNYVYDAIRALNAYEVKINFTGKMKQFTLTSTADDKVLQLVLPVKTYN